MLTMRKPPVIVLALILALSWAAIGHAEVLGKQWTKEGGGSWYDDSGWDPVGAPNNGGGISYEAELIAEGDVFLNSANTTTIDRLTISSPLAGLFVSSRLGILTGGILVRGVLNIGGPIGIGSDQATLSGDGMVVLAGGSIGEVSPPTLEPQLTTNITISGSGGLGGIEFINNFQILAENGVLTIHPSDNGFTNNGILGTYVDPDTGIFSRLELHAVGRGLYINNGTIEAADETEVRLIGAEIIGGTLRSIGTGHVTATSQSQRLKSVSFSGVLDVDAGATVFLENDITNDGTWNLNGILGSGAHLRIDESAQLMGGGEIIASDSISNAIHGSGVLLNVDHTISGAGRIEVRFINNDDGVILANVDKADTALTLSALDMVHHGLAIANQGGTMEVHGNTIGGRGSWRADGGNLMTRAANIKTCGTLRVDFGHLELENTKFRASSFRLGTDSSLRAFKGTQFRAASSEFQLTNGFVNELQDELDWDVEWIPETKFIFYGGLAAGDCEASSLPGTPAIEVAGTDGGNEGSFYSNNFQIPRVVIGPGATVQLADVVDNGNRNGPAGDTEALYVRTLEFADSAGRLRLNGLPIYYQNLIGNPSQIVDDTPNEECGDPTGDGMITATDALAALKAAIGAILCQACHCDVDNSGATTASDALRLLQAAVGQPVELTCVAC